MANPADTAAGKAARRMLGKKGIDVSMADVRVMHGICTIRGVVFKIKGFEGDLRQNAEQCAMLLKKHPDIKDVTFDVVYRGGDDSTK